MFTAKTIKNSDILRYERTNLFNTINASRRCKCSACRNNIPKLLKQLDVLNRDISNALR